MCVARGSSLLDVWEHIMGCDTDFQGKASIINSVWPSVSTTQDDYMNFQNVKWWNEVSFQFSTFHILSFTLNLLKDGGPFRMISLIIASSIRKPRFTLHMRNDAWRSLTKPEQWRAKTFYQSTASLDKEKVDSYQEGEKKKLARAFRFTDNFSSSRWTHAIRRLLKWSTHTKAEPRSRIRRVEDCFFTMCSKRPV